MTRVAAVVLWNDPPCEHRQAAWLWLQVQLAEHHPGWPVVVGADHSPLYSRTRAILDGCSKIDADVYVILDADVWVDNLAETARAAEVHGWAIPHKLLHRLHRDSTALVLGGADWRGLPLSDDNEQDQRPYVGHEAGTILAVRSDVLETAPPDPRFEGWGSEDDAWSILLNGLVGPPWRGRADCVHLWHPAQPRMNRRVGTAANAALLARYRKVRRDKGALRHLVAETRRQA